MRYEYDTIQIPPNIEISKNNTGGAAGTYLREILNKKAVEGWQFQSIETIGVSEKPGCFDALFGNKKPIFNYYVIIFKREIS